MIVIDMATNITLFGATLISLTEEADLFKLKVSTVVATVIVMLMLLVLFRDKRFRSRPKVIHASVFFTSR